MRIERVLPLVILVATSCDGLTGTPNGKFGDLGNGYFQYECTNEWDVMCRWGGYPTDFPLQIALGSRFSMAYEPTNSSLGGTPITVEPVSTEWISPAGAAFQALKPGSVSIIARSTKDGRVVDYLHVDVVKAFDLDVLTAEGGLPARTVFRGSQMTLIATPYDVYGDSLPGSLAWTWGSSDEGVVSLESVNGTPKMILYASGKGVAEVTISSGGATRTLTIEVLEKPGGVTVTDAGPSDAGPSDGGPTDTAEPDAGATDAGATDTGGADAGPEDTATEDAQGLDTLDDTGAQDAGQPDDAGDSMDTGGADGNG